MDLSQAIITEHAALQIAKRSISKVEVREVLSHPKEVITISSVRVVAQALSGRHLLRVFVDIDRIPPEVVTAYRTSKLQKYRSPQ